MRRPDAAAADSHFSFDGASLLITSPFVLYAFTRGNKQGKKHFRYTIFDAFSIDYWP